MYRVYNSQGIPILTVSNEQEADCQAYLLDGYYEWVA